MEQGEKDNKTVTLEIIPRELPRHRWPNNYFGTYGTAVRGERS